jgi:hypothetical protein
MKKSNETIVFMSSFCKLFVFLFSLFCVTFVSAQTVQNINFPDIPVKGYGDTTFTLNATASSGAVTYTSSNTAVATVSGSVVTIKGVGYSFISAYEMGTGTNPSAAPVAQLLVVCPKATLTVKADDKTISLGDANPTLTYTTTGFKNSQTSSVISGTPALSSTVNNLVVGTYPIVINRSTMTATNYEFMMEDGILSVNTSITTWNGSSWSNGIPNSFKEAIINGNYSTGASPGNGTFTARKLTVNSGTLTVTTGTNLTVVNELINNAGLTGVIVENNANLLQVNNVTNSGAITVKRETNALKILDYTLWSSPAGTTQTMSNFSPLTSTSRFYEYNPTTDLYNSVPATTTFSQGKGFLIRMPYEDPDNPGTGSSYYAGTASIIYKGVFTGVPNNGDVTLNNLLANKFYAIGNPYPSTISANSFLSANSTKGSLYFRRRTNGVTNSNSAYATYTTLGGTAAGNVAPNNIIPNGTIQVGQGFIVKTGLSATSLTFNNTMRTTNNSNQFFKTEQAVKDRIWLNLTNATGAFSQALIGYVDGATLGFDNGIDASYINDCPIALTSNINNAEYTIQGRPKFDPTDVVALNFKTDAAGNYSIALDHFEGVFATGQDIYLKDNNTDIETNLKTGGYTFTAAAGVDNTRFSLKYQKTLKVDAPSFNENNIMVYKNNGILYVKSISTAISNVKVYDIQGRLLAEQKKVNSPTAVINNLKATHQVLIVKITDENNNLVTKKVSN